MSMNMKQMIMNSIQTNSKRFASCNFHQSKSSRIHSNTTLVVNATSHRTPLTQHNTYTCLQRHHIRRQTPRLTRTHASQRPPNLDQEEIKEEINKILSELAVPGIGILVLVTILPFVVATSSPANLFAFVGLASATGYFLAPKYGIDPQAAVITVVGVTIGSLLLPFFLQFAFFLLIGYFIVNTLAGGLFSNGENSNTTTRQDDIFGNNFGSFNNFSNMNNFNNPYSNDGRKNMGSIDPRDVTIDIEAETIDD